MPLLIFGILSLIGAVAAVLLPETANQPLPQASDGTYVSPSQNVRSEYAKATQENSRTLGTTISRVNVVTTCLQTLTDGNELGADQNLTAMCGGGCCGGRDKRSYVVPAPALEGDTESGGVDGIGRAPVTTSI